MPRPTDDEFVLWIGRSIDLAQRCEKARDICVEHQDVVDAGAVRAVEVVGELITQLLKAPNELEPMLPEIPWKGYYDMRIFLAHKPWEVDNEIVWDTIKRDLPLLQAALPKIRTVLQEFAAG